MLNTKELMGDGSVFIHHFTLTKKVIPHLFEHNLLISDACVCTIWGLSILKTKREPWQ